MKCVVCKNGETQPGKAVITLVRNATTVVFKNVPAGVCQNCGEEYVSEDVTRELLKTAELAAKSDVEVDVREFIPA